MPRETSKIKKPSSPSTKPNKDETGSTLRGAQKKLTEQRLMEAARTVFRTKGFTDSTVDDIVQAIGASRGAFYLHFSGKKSIIGKLFVIDVVDDVIRLFHDYPKAPDIGSLKGCITEFLKIFERERSTIRAWIEAGGIEMDVEAAELQIATTDRIIAPLAHTVKRFRGARGLKTPDEEAQARALLMFIQINQFAYFHFIRGLAVSVPLVTALMANEWQAAIFSEVEAEVQ